MIPERQHEKSTKEIASGFYSDIHHTTSNIFDEEKIIEDRRIRQKTTTWNTSLATYLSQFLFFVSLAAALVAAA